MLCHQSTGAGTENEEQDYAIILYAFVPQILIFTLGIAKEQLCPAAEIASAHGGGIGHTMNLTETLHLHGTDEGNKGIGDQIVRTPQREPCDDEKNQDFEKKNDLSPVYFRQGQNDFFDPFIHEDPQYESCNGNEVGECRNPFSLR